MIVCIGCSWTRDWPGFLPDELPVVSRYCDGKGLGFLQYKLETELKDECNEADRIVVQLPTPVRSISTEGRDHPRTRIFLDFIQQAWKGAERVKSDKLLRAYRREVVSLNQAFPGKIIFFIFNTGGYPFRCPYDFGETAQSDMQDFFEENGFLHTTLHLQGFINTCVREVDSTKDKSKPKELVNVIQPRHRMQIVNPHPNERSSRIAANHVYAYLLHRGLL